MNADERRLKTTDLRIHGLRKLRERRGGEHGSRSAAGFIGDGVGRTRGNGGGLR